MNYIELLNNFWLQDEGWQFTSIETRMYFYLLKTANRLGWCNQWRRSDERVSIEAGISVNAMKKARIRLAEAGLIKYISGSGGGKKTQTIYSILPPRMFFDLTEDMTEDVTEDEMEDMTEVVTPSPIYISTRDKHKLKNKQKHCPPTLEEVKNYFEGKISGWEEQAELFYYHFDALGWHTAAGAKIRSWQGRARYWIKEEELKTNKNRNHGKKKQPHPNAGSTTTAGTTDGKPGNLDRLVDEILGKA